MIDKNCGFKDFTKVVRQDILKMICAAKSGHPGGSLSCVEILSVLYRKILNIPSDWKKSPDFNKRDRFILSKGVEKSRHAPILANVAAKIKNMETVKSLLLRFIYPLFYQANTPLFYK